MKGHISFLYPNFFSLLLSGKNTNNTFPVPEWLHLLLHCINGRSHDCHPVHLHYVARYQPTTVWRRRHCSYLLFFFPFVMLALYYMTHLQPAGGDLNLVDQQTPMQSAWNPGRCSQRPQPCIGITDSLNYRSQ